MSSSPRILILGAAGQVGRELQRSFAEMGEIVAVDREFVDIAQADGLRKAVRDIAPSVILNAAAYTAVDRAETDTELANAINATAPGVLAEESKRTGALLVHYSTDYVFDGSSERPWSENDEPNPLNVYGASKLAGERAVVGSGGSHLIFRTSWVYGPHGHNFLATMLRLGRDRERISVVDDQFGGPTTSIELADATRAIVEGALSGRFGTPDAWSGLYHMTCAGSTTWCGFARAIFARAGALGLSKVPTVDAILSSQYPTPARRPRSSVLSNAKLHAQFGVQLAAWDAALDAVIATLAARTA